MGGSPKISGGMTFAEQQKLMAEEREFQRQQEAERIKAAQDAETQRQAREKAEREGVADLFQEVIVPTEEIVEVKKGKKVNTERKFFPG